MNEKPNAGEMEERENIEMLVFLAMWGIWGYN